MRQIGYRAAGTACVFAALWFVLGLLLISTPLPGALGIAAQLFSAWLLLFLGILAITGAVVTIAAYNGVFPPNVRAPRASQSIWGPSAPEAPLQQRSPAAATRASRPPHRG